MYKDGAQGFLEEELLQTSLRSLQSSGLAAQEGPTEQEMDMGYTSYKYKEKYTYIKKILENKINCY